MKKLFLIFFIIFLIIVTTITKNSTKKLESQIFNVKENISILKNKYELVLLDYNYLTTPKKLMEYQSKYFENDLIFMDVFSKNSIPKKFCTGEFYTGLKRLISADGYVAFNTWVDWSSYGNYIKKLKNVFDAVIEQSVPISGNHIAFCK